MYSHSMTIVYESTSTTVSPATSTARFCSRHAGQATPWSRVLPPSACRWRGTHCRVVRSTRSRARGSLGHRRSIGDRALTKSTERTL